MRRHAVRQTRRRPPSNTAAAACCLPPAACLPLADLPTLPLPACSTGRVAYRTPEEAAMVRTALEVDPEVRELGSRGRNGCP